MSLLRPPSGEKPDDQSSQTPSGKEVPMAMSMMVDSMVHMIQKANNHHSQENNKEAQEMPDGN